MHKLYSLFHYLVFCQTLFVDPPEWNPSMPLEDADQEKEVTTRARAHARYEHLKASELAKLVKDDTDKDNKDKDKKKKKPLFQD